MDDGAGEGAGVGAGAGCGGAVLVGPADPAVPFGSTSASLLQAARRVDATKVINSCNVARRPGFRLCEAVASGSVCGDTSFMEKDFDPANRG